MGGGGSGPLGDISLPPPPNDLIKSFAFDNRDGVTASGLLVGALCVLQRLRSSQEVDIYRTVISLRRFCREFITSEVSNSINCYVMYNH